MKTLGVAAFLRPNFTSHAGRGFTIVELLIVIVVIAILAAITIVSFNGITHKAELSKMTAAAHYYEQALTMYHTMNGSYPMPHTEGDVEEYICLGTIAQFPADPAHGFAEGECNYEITGGEHITYNEITEESEELYQQLGEFVQGLPGDQLPFTESTSVNPGHHYFDRGFYYSNYNNEWVVLNYDVKNPTCLASHHRLINYDSVTGQAFCKIVFEEY